MDKELEEDLEVVQMKVRISRLEAKIRAIEELLFQMAQAFGFEVSTEERRRRSLREDG